MLQRERDFVSAVENNIGYCFKEKLFLISALSHSSYINERKLNKTASYERIEFLGDAVLELVSSTLLYHNYPDLSEGQLSKKRASLVCEQALAPCARRLELNKYILLGRGEEKNHGNEHDSILCDVIEAIIGAIYLDSGFDEAFAFIERHVLDSEALNDAFVDYKTIFQELIQARTDDKIVYELLDVSGPDHNRSYVVDVKVGERVYAKGEGSSKKAAEMAAAKCAIEAIQ